MQTNNTKRGTYGRLPGAMRIIFTALFLCVIFSMTPVHAAPKLNKTSAELYVGDTVKLKVRNTSAKVTWKTSAKKVATVAKGKVTAKKPGKAVITAAVGKKKLKCNVTVLPSYRINGQVVSKMTVNLKKGEAKTLKIRFELEGAVMSRIDNIKIANARWTQKWKEKDTWLRLTGNEVGKAVLTIFNEYNKDVVKIIIRVTE